MGVSETFLGGWSANVVDDTNVITVDMGHHELSSITRDVLLSGTSNVAAIGAPVFLHLVLRRGIGGME